MPMLSPEEINALLLDERSGVRESIVRDIGTSTVALFAISNPSAPTPLQFIGTGSLVRVRESRYILTAGHVWEALLKDSLQVGITLKEDIDHCNGINTKDFTAFELPRPEKWNEWGPDLVLLQVPPEKVGVIEVYRRFYPLDKIRPGQNGRGLEALILMGAPGEFGKYTSTHAELSINGFFSDVNAATYKHGDFDYVDLNEDRKFPGIPQRFGGVSGGGLWRVQIFGSDDRAGMIWQWNLEGVAFFEKFVPDETPITIRCHGIESIRAVMKLLPQPQTEAEK